MGAADGTGQLPTRCCICGTPLCVRIDDMQAGQCLDCARVREEPEERYSSVRPTPATDIPTVTIT